VPGSRFALRQLRRNPGLTAVAVLTLALGLGATVAIFSVVHGVLLRPLPYPEPERLVAVVEISTTGRPTRLADPNFADFRDQSRSFQAIAKYTSGIASVSGASSVPTRSRVAWVSPSFLDVFGVQPIRGRPFQADDGRKGAAPTVLVSHAYWRDHLGVPSDLSRSHLKIDRTVYAVIGVLPSGFRFPEESELWAPADLDGENPSRTSHNYEAVARLKPGVAIRQASQDVSAIARRIHQESGDQGDYLLTDARAVPLKESLTGRAKSPLLVLFAAVGFLLLVACANVANLLLAQAAQRERELALKTALGAPRGRLVRQFLAEALLLSTIGATLGLIGARAGVRALIALAPANLPRRDGVGINLPVLAFAVLTAAAVAAGLAAFTAARATSGDVRAALTEGGRGLAGSSRGRLGSTIVATQIAITLVLVVGAGLFGRSLIKVLEVDPGFDVDKVLAMDVSLPSSDDPQARTNQAALFRQLIDEAKRIPGMKRVGASSGLPLSGGHPDGLFAIVRPEEMPKSLDDLGALFQQKERLGTADFVVATDGYFQALGIPLARGRMFEERDGPDAPHVALITASLARQRWPGQDPLGLTIEFGNMDGDPRLLTIVGIVGDTREYGLDEPPRPTVYVNLFQRPRGTMTVTMLGDGDTAATVQAARAILERLDPEVPARFQTLRQVFTASLGSRRFNVVLMGCFGITALLLAAIGVLGVSAYSVSRRTREIGVRVALGATASDVRRMVLGQGLRTIAVGVAVGAAAALALTRVVGAMLYGVPAHDPVTFGGVTLLLVAVTLLACYLPARRATKVDPMVALRSD
jgi:predicted permease